MGRLNNKVAIITGAASGMGREDALLFAREGAVVVGTDINLEAVENVIKEITEIGGQAVAFKHNVATEEDWGRIVKEVIDQYGKIDILVNNAGISQKMSMDELTLDFWQTIIDINLTSVFLGMKAVIPHMKENNGGSIINISSIAGIKGSSGAGAYTASKGGVRMITKAAAVDYGKFNIRVNSVHPGFIETPMSIEYMKNEDYRKWFLSQIALPRLGHATDIAEAVLFLASDASSYITGVELPVDGGVIAK